MLLIHPRHLALSPSRLILRRAFPWTHTVGKILHATRSEPCPLGRLLIGSDYGGTHKGSNYRTYAYLVLASVPSSWWRRRNATPSNLQNDCLRRVSFKRLNDHFAYALASGVLEAGDKLPGVLVVFAVERGVRLHPLKSSDMKRWSSSLKLSAKWKHRSFEDAFLKAHFFALLVGQWAGTGSDVTWITDQDEFVANDKRLDDAQKLAAHLTSMYIPGPMGAFAMNTTVIDGPELEYEDLLALPDLSAGMISDLLTEICRRPDWRKLNSENPVHDENLKNKTIPLIDWFWDNQGELKKVCIVIDRTDQALRAFRLDQQVSPS